MAEEVIALKVSLDAADSANSVRDLKKAIKELENAALEAGNKGDEALSRKYAAAAGAARDKMADFKKEIQGVSDAGSKLGAIANVGATIASGFQAAQGAAALFGASGKDLEKVMLKVQAATALAQGAQALANATEDIAIAKKVVFTTVTNIANAASKAFGISAAASMALATAGITVLVGAVIGLIAYLSSATSESEKLAEQEKKRKEQALAANKFQEDFQIRAIENELKLAQAEGKSADEILAIRKRLLNAKIDIIKQEEDLLTTTVERSRELSLQRQDLENEIAVADAERNQQKIADAKKTSNEINKVKEDGIKKSEELEKLREQQAKDFIARTESEYNTANKLSDQYYSTLITNATIKGEDVKGLELKQLQDKLQNAKDYGQDLIEIQNQIALKEKEIADNKLTTAIKGIEDEKAKKKLALTEGSGGQGVSQAQQLQLDLEFDQKLFEIKLASGERDIALEQRIADTKIAIAKDDLALHKKVNDAKVQSAAITLGAISDITSLFGAKNEKAAKRAFDINKGIQIGQAIISTYQGANAIFAAAAANPATVLFPAQPFIAAGAAIIAGLANVAKISSQKFDGGGSGGSANVSTPSLSSGGGASGIPTPATSILGEGGQVTNITGNQNSKVYVTETDISATMKRVNVIEARAKVG